MKFAVSLLALAGLVAAADVSVDVGDDGAFAFKPTTVTASVGDTVNFKFSGSIHTVTQSSGLTAPCTAAGLDSGPGQGKFL